MGRTAFYFCHKETVCQPGKKTHQQLSKSVGQAEILEIHFHSSAEFGSQIYLLIVYLLSAFFKSFIMINFAEPSGESNWAQLIHLKTLSSLSESSLSPGQICLKHSSSLCSKIQIWLIHHFIVYFHCGNYLKKKCRRDFLKKEYWEVGWLTFLCLTNGNKFTMEPNLNYITVCYCAVGYGKVCYNVLGTLRYIYGMLRYSMVCYNAA